MLTCHLRGWLHIVHVIVDWVFKLCVPSLKFEPRQPHRMYIHNRFTFISKVRGRARGKYCMRG